MLSHPVTRRWGSGNQASADMMSLDATRHLWNARTEPRRGTRAIGTYSHTLDQWPIICDQAIVLNQRQAGVAIEGVLQQQIATLQRLAVDTHGFTHFAMGLAKLLGFDLCPRLAGFSGRKLYLPRGISVPARLEPIVERVPLGRTARKGWDELQHIAASLQSGYGSAATIIERHGSAARGNTVYECGTLIGKVMRSVFMLDYLSIPNSAARFIVCSPRVNHSTPCSALCWPGGSRPNMAGPRMMRTPSAVLTPCSPMSCWPGIPQRCRAQLKPTPPGTQKNIWRISCRSRTDTST